MITSRARGHGPYAGLDLLRPGVVRQWPKITRRDLRHEVDQLFEHSRLELRAAVEQLGQVRRCSPSNRQRRFLSPPWD